MRDDLSYLIRWCGYFRNRLIDAANAAGRARKSAETRELRQHVHVLGTIEHVLSQLAVGRKLDLAAERVTKSAPRGARWLAPDEPGRDVSYWHSRVPNYAELVHGALMIARAREPQISAGSTGLSDQVPVDAPPSSDGLPAPAPGLGLPPSHGAGGAFISTTATAAVSQE